MSGIMRTELQSTPDVELITTVYTDEEDMAKTSEKERHDRIYKQLRVFTELQRRLEKLTAELPPEAPAEKQPVVQNDVAFKKKIHKRLIRPPKKTPKREEKKPKKPARTSLDTATETKIHFDKHIHLPLYLFYYNALHHVHYTPLEDLVYQESECSDTNSNSVKSETDHSPSPSTTQQQQFSEFSCYNNCEKMSYAVEGLHGVSKKWDETLLSNATQKEKLTSCLDHGNQATRLAQLWWISHTQLAKGHSSRNRYSEENKHVHLLTQTLSVMRADLQATKDAKHDLEIDIEENEQWLNKVHRKRTLCEQAEQEVNIAALEYNNMMENGANTQTITTLMNIRNYKFNILSEDFLLELKIRPQHIYHLADLETRLKEVDEEAVKKEAAIKEVEDELQALQGRIKIRENVVQTLRHTKPISKLT